ncbi:MAG: hypothetical protein KGL39_10865 [Patescibacteria group bacterium]|nr:hypothetical protein [Patescibacteria group bacterium]
MKHQAATFKWMASEWYVGFDCATKTFGFCILKFALAYYREHRDRLWATLRRAQAGRATRAEIRALDRETRGLIRFADGDVTDLFPGRADADIHTVERVRALIRHVNARVVPSIGRLTAGHEKKDVNVPIEFQMGPNAPARVISDALITLFHEYNVFLVGPALKNKVWCTEAGRHCYFVEKFARVYDANKAHTAFNFEFLETTFGTEIPPTKPKKKRGHIADSAMQVFGYVLHGDKSKEQF